ncbi:MAG TPA: DUF481 domain-containing protein [Vicinamibacterales bacterium]|nr:DUF481 domain-containing protein [Vicinamibacterales bacterium]
MTHIRLRSTVSFCVLLAFAAGAQAQPPGAPDEQPPRVEATAQAAFLATTGNSSTETLGFGGELIFRPAPWVFLGKAALAQNSDRDELKARSLTALFRADRVLSPRLSAFSQYDYLHDIFAGIEDRHTIQGGLAYLAVDHPQHRLRLDGGVGFQHEGRLNAENSNSAIAQGGLNYRWKITSTSELVEELRASLPFANTDQWKLDQSVALTAAINSIFSLKVSNVVRFVNAPVPGFESTDTTTTVALVMKFTRPAR